MTLQVGADRVVQEFTGAPGVTPPSEPGGRPEFLDDVIVAMGFADRETVSDAVERGRLSATTAAALLLDQGHIDEQQLARAIAERNGLPFVDLGVFPVNPDAKRLIGRDAARRYRAVPIAFDADGALIVALADPTDVLAVSDIGEISKSEVRAAVAIESAIGELIDQMPRNARPAAVRFDADQVHSAGDPAEVAPGPDPPPVAGPESPPALKPGSPDAEGEAEPEFDDRPPEPEPTRPNPEEDPVPETDANDVPALKPLRIDPGAFGPPPGADEDVDEPVPAPEEQPAALPDLAQAEPEPFFPELRVDPLRIDAPPASDAEPFATAEPDPGPFATAEPKPAAPAPEPEPADLAEPPAAARQTSGALQGRIADLIQAAVDDVAATEVERLEAELKGERELRIELEGRLEEEGATREEMAKAIGDANREIDAVSARLEKYERKSQEFKAQRDEARAERDRLRETAAEAGSAVERELAIRTEREQRLRERLSGADDSREGLEQSLGRLEAAISDARDAAQGLAAFQAEVSGELDPA